ncbi:MAG TPA: branched-chain amino acid ABC transporter permease [Limnochordales bacterium]|nr:branched-chain amino acid ABC transporter permease [Limnochordales bacterium]
MSIPAYYITMAIITGIYTILALSLNIITGFAGQPNMGHAAFFGIGAYTLAILTTRYEVAYWLAALAAAVAAGAVGSLLGLISLRVREDFLAITTIGINFVVVSVFLYHPFFGQAFGIGNIPMPSVLGQALGRSGLLVVVVLTVVAVVWISRRVEGSWFGLALESLREDEEAAEAVGIDTRRFKVLAFALGTALAGFAGALYASFMSFISPGDFTFPLSITILCMAVVGGLGTIRGPVVGAIVLSLLPEVFRFVMDYRLLVYGGLLVLMMRLQPSGLLGRGSFLMRCGERWRMGRRRSAAVS